MPTSISAITTGTTRCTTRPHAEKAATPGSDPVSSPAGEQRARDLATALTDAHVAVVITTQFQRTQMTAKPIADLAGVTPIVVATASDTKAHASAVAAKAKASARG